MYESVPFTGKRPQRPETGIKDGFEEMEHEFLFGIFRPEKKQEYFFRFLLLPEIFRWNDQKSHVPFTFQPEFPKTFCEWQTTAVYHLYKSVTRPRKPATGIEDGFEQMEHEFPFGTFRPQPRPQGNAP